MVESEPSRVMEKQEETPNSVLTKRNKTMLDQIRENNSGPFPQTSYGRASTQ